MLLEFSTANFRSFRDRATLSLVASTDNWLDDDNVAVMGDYRAVKAAAIYGPNAGGKSNLLAAVGRMREWVINSSKESQQGEEIPVTPFRLNTKTETAPTFFEAIFLVGDKRYRYGFEADRSRVWSEWLLMQGDSTRETTLFQRERDQIKPGAEFKEGNGLEVHTRSNALYLSVVAQLNGKVAGEIVSSFKGLRSISGVSDAVSNRTTAKALETPEYRDVIRELVKHADLGIEDIRSQIRDPEKMNVELPAEINDPLRQRLSKHFFEQPELKTSHRKFDGDQKLDDLVEFDLGRDESAGTNKYVSYLGPFLETLHRGSVLFVDEFEARLHPHLTQALVALFDSASNRTNAQLVFASHDPALLNSRFIRRDQVWFVEKDDRGASSLYPLSDFSVRKEGKFEKEYLAGQFGGVPHLGDLREILDHATEK